MANETIYQCEKCSAESGIETFIRDTSICTSNAWCGIWATSYELCCECEAELKDFIEKFIKNKIIIIGKTHDRA
jgi:DNA-directed RNA polymerase subunit RPC12/RpoP